MVLIYDFALQTLLKTLVNLGADYAAVYDSYGNISISPHNEDHWVNEKVVSNLEALIGTRPIVSARRDVLAFSARHLRVARIIVTAVPGGYLVTVLGGLQGWLSDVLARDLADAIENWANERVSPWAPTFPSRFYPGMSRRFR